MSERFVKVASAERRADALERHCPWAALAQLGCSCQAWVYVPEAASYLQRLDPLAYVRFGPWRHSKRVP